MIVIPNEGAEEIIGAIVDRAALLRLFVNDQAPRKDDSQDSFAEPEGNGYEPKPLVRSEWNIDGPDAVYSEVVFEFAGPVGDIAGWFITTQTGTVLFAELFKEPMGFTRFGGRARVMPFFSIRRAK